MKLYKKLFFLIILFLIIGLSYSWYMVNSSYSKPGIETNFIITKGEGVNEISAHLYSDKFISNKFVFETYVWLKKMESKFIAGTYRIPSGSSMVEIVDLLTNGRKPDEITLRFIEGWTTRDIKQYLLKEKVIATADEFDEWNKIGKWQEQFSYLQNISPDLPLEGFLFPDTYNFFVDVKPRDIIEKMLRNFDKKLNEKMRSDIAASGGNIYDTIILASIVEKEVRHVDDMAKIADIFKKRMKLGMMLQADSTLNYVIHGTSTRLNSEQLKIDSPYNSYKYAGLPPTPISNPGLNAIRAVIYPEVNDYYFFLTDKQGKVYYGKTLDEHNYNRRYMQ